MIARDKIKNVIKQDIADDLSRPIRRCYDAVVSSALRRGQFVRNEVPEFVNIRSSLQRSRNELLPPIPRNVNDVHIRGPWRKTWGNEPFLMEKDNEWGIVLFGTKENMTVLNECKYVFVDGTFRTSPRPYYQVLTIHGRFGKRVIHLATALMKGKSVGEYRQVFKALKRGVRYATGSRLKPRFVVCDYELALITCVETEFQRTKVLGCVFHLTESINRKVGNLGMKAAFKRDNQLRPVILKLLSLCYLPLAVVRVNFLQLFHTLATTNRRLVQRYPTLRDLFNYVRATYIDGNYPPTLWNCFNRDSFARSNNYVESEYRKAESRCINGNIRFGYNIGSYYL
jgi:hypothetical protein